MWGCLGRVRRVRRVTFGMWPWKSLEPIPATVEPTPWGPLYAHLNAQDLPPRKLGSWDLNTSRELETDRLLPREHSAAVGHGDGLTDQLAPETTDARRFRGLSLPCPPKTPQPQLFFESRVNVRVPWMCWASTQALVSIYRSYKKSPVLSRLSRIRDPYISKVWPRACDRFWAPEWCAYRHRCGVPSPSQTSAWVSVLFHGKTRVSKQPRLLRSRHSQRSVQC